MTDFGILGTPFQIAGVTIKNRYAFSPVNTATQWDDPAQPTSLKQSRKLTPQPTASDQTLQISHYEEGAVTSKFR